MSNLNLTSSQKVKLTRRMPRRTKRTNINPKMTQRQYENLIKKNDEIVTVQFLVGELSEEINDGINLEVISE